MTALCAVDAGPLAAWLAAIPFEEWPQQARLADGRIRPAMVTDLGWHGFGSVAAPLVGAITKARTQQWMLSAVMPGHDISPHRDEQPPYWLHRIHVPLLTNESAWFIIEGVPHRFDLGYAYAIDTRLMHSVVNNGTTPRVHFMVDVLK